MWRRIFSLPPLGQLCPKRTTLFGSRQLGLAADNFVQPQTTLSEEKSPELNQGDGFSDVDSTGKEKFTPMFNKLVEHFQIPTGPENAQNPLDWALSLGSDRILLNDSSIRSRLESLASQGIIKLVFDGESISQVLEVEF